MCTEKMQYNIVGNFLINLDQFKSKRKGDYGVIVIYSTKPLHMPKQAL